MRTKLLKGFTMLEALISLMLMSLIIVISYSLFNLIVKQLSLFNEEHNQVLEYNLFNSTLMSDIESAHNFDIINNQLTLRKYNETELNYTITANYILRKNTIKTDTFKVQVINYEFVEKRNASLNKTLQIKLYALNDTIKTNYFLNKDNSEVINAKYFNED